jgi:hypothetical protein
VTIVDSLAGSYLSQAALALGTGSAAESAAVRKEGKYRDLSQQYIFQPIAFETIGSINSSAIEFISELGRRCAEQSGIARESDFLFQRLSVAVQRFNAVAFRGSFDAVADSDD